MLYGGFDHSIDKKGRVSVPYKFREDLGEQFIVCKDITGKSCLRIYSAPEWAALVEKISALPSSTAGGYKRFVFDGAFNVEFDAQGRIVIPPSLREFASLNSSAHLVGMDKYVEVWSSELWAEEEVYTPEEIFSVAQQFNF